MAAEENKATARMALEHVWSAAGTASAGDVYSTQFVGHQNSHQSVTDIRGIEALKAFLAEFHRAFPDFEDTVELQISEGDMVATRFTSSGTHKGEFMGVAPTGQRIEWRGIEIARLEDGKIAENWVSWDRLGVLEQLGGVASPG